MLKLRWKQRILGFQVPDLEFLMEEKGKKVSFL